MSHLANKYQLSQWQRLGLLIFFIIGIGHNFIANDNYLICFDGSESFMAADCKRGIPALIPYSSKNIDRVNRGLSPFSKQAVSSLYCRHWLGTDALGRDVLAGLVHGTNIALKIGIGATLLALLLGTFFGFLSGYIGDKGFRIPKIVFFFYLGIALACLFYFVYGSTLVKFLSVFCITALTFLIIRKSEPENLASHYIAIPFDLIVMRLIEIFRSIPILFTILVLIGIIRQPSVSTIIILIAAVRWPTVARFIRAEILKVKEEQFVQSARALGLSQIKVFLDHILPLSVSPVIISSAFGVSIAILLESTLSFLGLGISVDQVTWGSMLNGARSNFSMWWLAFLPGLLIYLVIFLFNSIGDNFNESLRAKN